jgi:hypothetical protein
MINSFMRAARDFEGHLQAFALVCIIGAIALAPSVVTLKPATCGHFKTGHFGWLRRDCFTLSQGAFARC